MTRQSRMASLFYQNPVYEEMMNHMSELVYVYDDQGRVVFMNRAAEEFEGLKLSEVRGLYVGDIYYQDYSPTLKALETGKEVSDSNNVYMFRGRRFTQVTHAYPFYEEGKIIGVLTVQSDVTTLERVLAENIRLQKKTSAAETSRTDFDSLVGKSGEFLRCVEIARSAARNESPVLLSGPTGSGKEMFAKSIHNSGARKKGPFLAINCAAIPDTLLESILFGTAKGSFTGAMDKPGLFEQAKGGTLFLDEINSMSLSSQAKILRVLEEKECRRVGGDKDIKIDVRIISSINESPREILEKKVVRADLFYRLAVISIMIPPLAARQEDLKLLTDYFLDKYNRKLGKQIIGLDDEAEEFFKTFSWPGNIRQLKHALESAVSMAGEDEEKIGIRHLPQYLFESRIAVDILRPDAAEENPAPEEAEKTSSDPEPQSRILPGRKQADTKETPSEEKTSSLEEPPLQQPKMNLNKDIREQVRQEECRRIIQTLYECGGNVSKAARVLNMHRQSLIYKMKKYDIR